MCRWQLGVMVMEWTNASIELSAAARKLDQKAEATNLASSELD